MGIFGLEFENAIVFFEISINEFVKLEELVQKWKFWDQKCLI